MFKATGKGLEIGPSHNPIMPKAAGYQVEILDYIGAEELRRKYAGAGVDVSAIEEVDHIGDGRPLPDIIGDRHRYDWIVASHVIEHVPDLLAFLGDCEAMLKPGGSLVLAVPDKRCCFDVLRPVSTVGQVLQAHVDGRRRPPPGVVFDDVAYARKRNGRIGWSLGDQGNLQEVRPWQDAWHVFEQVRGDNSYVDMHCWVFVPSSFQLIIRTLAACGMTGLRELSFRAEEGEFFAVLSASAPLGQPLDFGGLTLAAQAEEREVPHASPCTPEGPDRLPAEAQLAKLRQDLSLAQAALSAALEREANAARRISVLTRSTSWQITAPVRAIGTLLKSRPRPRLGSAPFR